MDGILQRRRTAAVFCCGLSVLLLGPQHPFAGSGETFETIEGELVAGGVECPLFRLSDGREATLQGALPDGHAAEGKLRLRGQWIEVSMCQQGRTFLVKDVLEPDG